MAMGGRALIAGAIAVLVLLAGAWGLQGTPGPASAQVDLLDLSQRELDALNAGDVEGVLGFYAEDAMLQGSPGCLTPCVGTEAIRMELESIVADNLRVALISATVSDSTVTRKTEATSDSIRAAGVERIVVSETLEFRGGKISFVTAKVDLADEETRRFLDFLAKSAQPAEAPATGIGSLRNDGGGRSSTWWYALVAGGVLLVLGGLASLKRARRRG